MKLETKNLILRNYKSSDFDDVHEYGSLPDFSQYDVWGPNSEDDTRNFINEKASEGDHKNRYTFDLAIFHKGDEKVIGGVGIRRAGERSQIADMGYAVNPKYQGQGLATEACREILNFGFKELGLIVVWATCDTENISSWKVMEKLGMTRIHEGIGTRKYKGKISDEYRYEITRSQWDFIREANDLDMDFTYD